MVTAPALSPGIQQIEISGIGICSVLVHPNVFEFANTLQREDSGSGSDSSSSEYPHGSPSPQNNNNNSTSSSEGNSNSSEPKSTPSSPTPNNECVDAPIRVSPDKIPTDTAVVAYLHGDFKCVSSVEAYLGSRKVIIFHITPQVIYLVLPPIPSKNSQFLGVSITCPHKTRQFSKVIDMESFEEPKTENTKQPQNIEVPRVPAERITTEPTYWNRCQNWLFWFVLLLTVITGGIVVTGLWFKPPPFDANSVSFPELPEPYLERKELIELYKQELLDPSTKCMAIFGPRYSGKSVIAAALAHQFNQQGTFSDGVKFLKSWRISESMTQLVGKKALFVVESFSFEDLENVTNILDPGARLLVVTANSTLASKCTIAESVPPFSEEEAIEFLNLLVHIPEEDQIHVKRIVKRLKQNLLALRLIHKLPTISSWAYLDLLIQMEHNPWEDPIEDAISLAIQVLPPVTAHQLLDLDHTLLIWEPLSVDVAAEIWEVSEEEAQSALSTLIQFGLLTVKEGTPKLHREVAWVLHRKQWSVSYNERKIPKIRKTSTGNWSFWGNWKEIVLQVFLTAGFWCGCTLLVVSWAGVFFGIDLV